MVEIDGLNLTPEAVEAVVRGVQARLTPQARARVDRSRDMVETILEERRPVYAISTGVGPLCSVVISPADARAFQLNIVHSHAAGVGQPLPETAVRAMMLLRANALAGGCSGVRPALIDMLLEMLARGVHPVIPEKGSLGASGDLAPLAHLALVLVGEGKAVYDGVCYPGAEALQRAGLEPLVLEAKEGIALINGTQFISALGILFLKDAERLAEVSDIAGALTLEALGGTDRAFHPLVHAARPHPGQVASARHILRLLSGSQRVAREEYSRIQDGYSLRCMPQVHGAARGVLAHLREVLTVEINSATDNPLLFPDENEVISGGNFHGEPLALALDYAAMAVAELAAISERRIERLVNPQLSGLPASLVTDSGLRSGYMLAQYTAAALVSENRVLCHPASVDNVPSGANQEDHVSMGAHAARKAAVVLANSQQVLGVELVVASQAVEFGVGDLGAGTDAAYRAVRTVVPHLDEDRVIAADFAAGMELVRSNGIVRAVREAIHNREVAPS